MIHAFLPKLDGERVTLTFEERPLADLVAPGMTLVRQTAYRTTSMNNLKQLGLAMFNKAFEAEPARFPAQASFDKQNKPLLSWRVHLLPYIEQQQLYKEFKLDEPWDSEHNKKLIAKMPKVYANPFAPKLAAEGKTTYLAPVHKDAIFTGAAEGMLFTEIKDGSSQTVLLSRRCERCRRRHLDEAG